MAGLGSIPAELAALFAPQVEQLGIHLERQGNIWAGEAKGNVASGGMWLCAPSPHCLVLCHAVTPLKDMSLFESSLGAYACACAMGSDAAVCSRGCGLPIRLMRPETAGGRKSRDTVATFVERAPRALSSRLLAGRTYRSRSLLFLPDFFDELERRYPGEFRNLFSSFGRCWSKSSELAIQRALDAIPDQPALRASEELKVLSTITALMASLAAGETDGKQNPGSLVRQAKELIAAVIEQSGATPSASTIARKLYVSRSHLYDAFKRETGQSVGAYARQLRLERAYRLLNDENLSIAETSGLLGYSSPSAFCHAFASATGVSPREWRSSRTLPESQL